MSGILQLLRPEVHQSEKENSEILQKVQRLFTMIIFISIELLIITVHYCTGTLLCSTLTGSLCQISADKSFVPL